MSTMASQITGISIVCSTVGSGADQRKYQNSASLAFVRGIHRSPVNFPYKRPVTRKMFPFDDDIMVSAVGNNHRWQKYEGTRHLLGRLSKRDSSVETKIN